MHPDSRAEHSRQDQPYAGSEGGVIQSKGSRSFRAAMISSGSAFRANGLGLSAFVFTDEAVDGGLELDGGMEDAVPEPAPREFGEEALDGIECLLAQPVIHPAFGSAKHFNGS